MHSKFNLFISAVLITVIYVMVFQWQYGIYDDTKDIAYRSALLRGDFTSVPLSNLFIYFIAVSKILSWLFNHFKSVSWIGIELLLLHSFAVFATLFLLMRAFRKAGISSIVSVSFAVFAGTLFFSESLFYFSIACSCMVGAAAAVQWLVFEYPHIQRPAFRYLSLFVSIGILLLSVLTQNEVTLIGLIALFLYLIICYEHKMRVLKMYAVVAVVYIVVYLSNHFLGDSYMKEFLQNEAYLFTYYDTFYHKYYPTAEPADMIKLEAMRHWFVWDKQQFNVIFFEKITTNSFLTTLGGFAFSHKLQLYLSGLQYGLCKRLQPVAILNLFVFLYGLLILRNSRKAVAQFIFYKLSLILFFSAVSIVLKFEFRVLQPILVFDTFLSLLFVVTEGTKQYKVGTTFKWVFLFPMFIILLWGWQWKHHYLEVCKAEQIEAIAYGQQFRKEIDEKFKDKTIVPDLGVTLPLVANAPWQTAPVTLNNKILGYDCGYTTYYREFDELLMATCGGNDFDSFMKYLWSQKEDVVFIASAEKIQLWQKYLQVLYNTKVDFVFLEPAGPFKQFEHNGNTYSFSYYTFGNYEKL